MVSITSPTQITTSAQIAPGTILGSDIAGNAAIHFTQMEAVTAGKLIMGNASNEAAQLAMSGDATISSAGAVAIASNVIVNDDVNTSAAIAISKLAALPSAQIIVGSAGNVPTAVAMSGDVSIANTGATAISGLALSKLAALPSTQIIVGNSSNVAAAAAMSGDVTIGNTGVTAIGSGKVTEAMQILADNTTNNVSASAHGYAPKFPNNTTTFLRGDGTYAAPGGGAINFLTSHTSGTNTTTITFSSLTANAYLLRLRTYSSANPSVVQMQFNSDTGANYASGQIYYNGAAVLANTPATSSGGISLIGNGGFADITVWITKETTGGNAVWSSTFGGADDYLAGTAAGVWANGAAKITSITLTLQSGDFIANGLVALYSVATA